MAKALSVMACALIFSCNDHQSASHPAAAGDDGTGGVANRNMPTQGGQVSAAGAHSDQAKVQLVELPIVQHGRYRGRRQGVRPQCG